MIILRRAIGVSCSGRHLWNAYRYAHTPSRGLHALVLGERNDAGVVQAGSIAAVSAARKAVGDGGSVDMLVWGPAADGGTSAPDGVQKLFRASHESLRHPVAEVIAPIVQKLQQENSFSHIFAGTSTFAKNVMPRIAAKLDSSQISDIVAVESSNQYVRPIYAGNALATVRSKDPVQVVTVRATAFDSDSNQQEGVDAVDVVVPEESSTNLSSWDSEKLTEGGSRPELTAAKVVVSGGRGLKNGDNFALIEKLADKLGGAIGATRAAVDDGYCPNDMQVGQTGKVVAPDLYIAVGLSGAVQHLAGMKDSKAIVAINKDPDAPIFAIADYGLVADLFEAVPQLLDELGGQK